MAIAVLDAQSFRNPIGAVGNMEQVSKRKKIINKYNICLTFFKTLKTYQR